MNDKMIEALLEERRGYVMRGKKDRVKAVDDALLALGYKVKEAASFEPETETASIGKPRKRKA